MTTRQQKRLTKRDNAIRDFYARTPGATQALIAERYGLSQATISQILNKKGAGN